MRVFLVFVSAFALTIASSFGTITITDEGMDDDRIAYKKSAGFWQETAAEKTPEQMTQIVIEKFPELKPIAHTAVPSSNLDLPTESEYSGDFDFNTRFQNIVSKKAVPNTEQLKDLNEFVKKHDTKYISHLLQMGGDVTHFEKNVFIKAMLCGAKIDLELFRKNLDEYLNSDEKDLEELTTMCKLIIPVKILQNVKQKIEICRLDTVRSVNITTRLMGVSRRLDAELPLPATYERLHNSIKRFVSAILSTLSPEEAEENLAKFESVNSGFRSTRLDLLVTHVKMAELIKNADFRHVHHMDNQFANTEEKMVRRVENRNNGFSSEESSEEMSSVDKEGKTFESSCVLDLAYSSNENQQRKSVIRGMAAINEVVLQLLAFGRICPTLATNGDDNESEKQFQQSVQVASEIGIHMKEWIEAKLNQAWTDEAIATVTEVIRLENKNKDALIKPQNIENLAEKIQSRVSAIGPLGFEYKVKLADKKDEESINQAVKDVSESERFFIDGQRKLFGVVTRNKAAQNYEN